VARGPQLAVALVHHPVINRKGEEITSTIDHFDVMDGSRLALTYGLARLFVVNPVPAQQALVERLIRHGMPSAERDETRGDLGRVAWAPDLETAIAELDTRPTIVATSAKRSADAIEIAAVRERLHAGEPMLLVLGKAWGLAPSVIEAADLRLAPIDAGTGFNHLSVRSAMAILVDRLLG
jgi:hypothetical protein